jgi:hypothetical protein
VAKEAATIAKKMQMQFTQLLNEASCSNEPDIFVEMREEDWYCFICVESRTWSSALLVRTRPMKCVLVSAINAKASSVNCVEFVNYPFIPTFFFKFIR